MIISFTSVFVNNFLNLGKVTHNSDLFRAWIIDNITSQRLIDIALRQVDVQDSNIREVFDWNFQRGCHNNKLTLEDVSMIFLT